MPKPQNKDQPIDTGKCYTIKPNNYIIHTLAHLNNLKKVNACLIIIILYINQVVIDVRNFNYMTKRRCAFALSSLRIHYQRKD